MEKINRITGFFRKTVTGLICSVLLQSAFLSDAAAASISLISDEETEQFLARQLRPVFKAAGIPFNRNNIYIVNDDSLNAFVGDGNNMFVHTGTLMKANDENEIAGVLAHETGHIMGGHILRQKIKLQNMQQISLASMLAAGAAAAATGRADAAIAIMMGTQSSMLNAMLAYQVEEERSADESAVKLCKNRTKSGRNAKFHEENRQAEPVERHCRKSVFSHTSRYCRAHQFSEQCGQAIPFSGTGTPQQRISAGKGQIVRLYGRTAQSAAKISAERQIDTGALCAGNRFFQNAQT